MMKEDNPFSPPESEIRQDLHTGEYDEKAWKNLKHHSQTIKTLALLWTVGAAVIAILGILNMTEGLVVSGVYLVFSSLFPAACAYVAFDRPIWGRIPGIIICGLLIFKGLKILNGETSALFPFLIGVVGMRAFWQGKDLFGPNRITHKELMKGPAPH